MLGMPEPTAYDLRFRLLGIPVRVHPLFWIVMAVMGGGGENEPPADRDLDRLRLRLDPGP